jgi:hypothetical protein
MIYHQIVEATAKEFALRLMTQLSPEAWAEMIRRNSLEEYLNSGCCASHDYCDPNMVMHDSVQEILTEYELDFVIWDAEGQMTSKAITLINDAWERAGIYYLSVNSRKLGEIA